MKKMEKTVNPKLKTGLAVALATVLTGSLVLPLHARQEIQRAGKGLISLQLSGSSLRSTLEMLARRLGRNIMIDAEVPDQQLSMSLQSIRPRDAFAAILAAHELGYKVLEGSVLYVAPLEKIDQNHEIRHIHCKYADAVELVDILTRVSDGKDGAVMADARTNTLIIRERPEVLARMEKLVAELDRPTMQVYIQAEIVEVSSSDGKKFGIEWILKELRSKDLEGRAGSDWLLQQSAATNTTGTVGSTPTGTTSTNSQFPFPIGSGFGIGILGTNVSVVLRALRESNQVNLLSRPRIVTLDNQEASIEVGDQIPFKVLNQFGVTSFEFKDATIQLLVKPHIIDSLHLALDVTPKADFQNGFTPDGTPIISTRRAQTRVKIRDGETVVIGGLIRDSEIKSEKRVPVLGRLPWIGFLFRDTISTVQKTELIVFITPIIMREGRHEGLFESEKALRKKVRDKSQ